jgi:hypothetical protein
MLNYRVEQDAVEAPVAKADAALVMLEKGLWCAHDPKMSGSLLHHRAERVKRLASSVHKVARMVGDSCPRERTVLNRQPSLFL